MLKKLRLFTAGPTPLHPDAMRAASGPVPYHRTPAFSELLDRVQVHLRAAFRTDGPVAVLATSGTGAMEAAVANFFAAGDRVVSVEGGKFGERWGEISRAYGLDAAALRVEAGAALGVDALMQHLDGAGDVRGLLLTASETSTGTIYDVRGFAEAVRAQYPDIVIVVDAITAIGAMQIHTDGWGLDAVVGGAQKAFMIPPGLAFVACSPRGWEMIQGGARDAAILPRFAQVRGFGRQVVDAIYPRHRLVAGARGGARGDR